MKKNDLDFENNLLQYYFAFKDLFELHRGFDFGKAPRLSEGFTENLCCFLYGFKKEQNVKREYDLKDHLNDHKIEVKATSDFYGATTINPRASFDYLYWLNFHLEFDTLWVSKLEHTVVHKNLLFNETDKRKNISLSRIERLGEVDFFHFSKKEMKIVEISLENHLDLIKKFKKVS